MINVMFLVPTPITVGQQSSPICVCFPSNVVSVNGCNTHISARSLKLKIRISLLLTNKLVTGMNKRRIDRIIHALCDL